MGKIGHIWKREASEWKVKKEYTQNHQQKYKYCF